MGLKPPTRFDFGILNGNQLQSSNPASCQFQLSEVLENEMNAAKHHFNGEHLVLQAERLEDHNQERCFYLSSFPKMTLNSHHIPSISANHEISLSFWKKHRIPTVPHFCFLSKMCDCGKFRMILDGSMALRPDELRAPVREHWRNGTRGRTTHRPPMLTFNSHCVSITCSMVIVIFPELSQSHVRCPKASTFKWKEMFVTNSLRWRGAKTSPPGQLPPETGKVAE